MVGISKNNVRSIYSINKTKDFFQKARKFLAELKIYNPNADAFGIEYNKQNKPADKDISKMKDLRESFESEDNIFLDFIFSEKKVFIIISYKKDLQQEFAELMFKYFEEDLK